MLSALKSIYQGISHFLVGSPLAEPQFWSMQAYTTYWRYGIPQRNRFESVAERCGWRVIPEWWVSSTAYGSRSSRFLGSLVAAQVAQGGICGFGLLYCVCHCPDYVHCYDRGLSFSIQPGFHVSSCLGHLVPGVFRKRDQHPTKRTTSTRCSTRKSEWCRGQTRCLMNIAIVAVDYPFPTRHGYAH